MPFTCRAKRRHKPKNVIQHFSVQERALRCVADLNVAEATDTHTKDKKELFSLQLFSKLHFRLYTFSGLLIRIIKLAAACHIRPQNYLLISYYNLIYFLLIRKI
jgi:hypothetical protein